MRGCGGGGDARSCGKTMAGGGEVGGAEERRRGGNRGREEEDEGGLSVLQRQRPLPSPPGAQR